MSEEQSKILLKHKVLLAVLIIANIGIGGFVVANRRTMSDKRTNKATNSKPSLMLGANETVKSRLMSLTNESETDKAAIAMFTSISSGCSSGILVETLKSHFKETDNAQILILLPNTFTDEDLNNFKNNWEVSFQVERADEDLTKFWLSLAEQYREVSVNGVVVLNDGKKTSVLQDINEINQQLSDFSYESIF